MNNSSTEAVKMPDAKQLTWIKRSVNQIEFGNCHMLIFPGSENKNIISTQKTTP